MQVPAPNQTKTPDREDLRELEKVLERQFPRPLEASELVLMDVSPHRLHAYWEITPPDLAATGIAPEEAQFLLRFHDLSDDNLSRSFDIEISGPSGSRYVELWEDARRYQAELGVLGENGTLIDLARSNLVELPRAGVSHRPGSRVLTLTPAAEKLYETEDRQAADRPKKIITNWRPAENQLNDATLQRGIKQLFPLFPDPGAPLFTPREFDLGESTEEPCPAGVSLPQQGVEALQVTEIPHRPHTLPAHGVEAGGFPLCTVEELEEMMLERAAIPTPLDSLQAMAQQVPAGFAFAPTANRHKAVPPSAGAIPYQHHEAPLSPTTQPVSSYSLVDSADAELTVELIIHGRGLPNSHFVFHGHAIATGADGSFSLRTTVPPESRQLVAQLLAASQLREG